MPSGTITRINKLKGFGFIAATGSTEDVFFHMSELRGGLEWDDQLICRRITFEDGTNPRDGRAVAINIQAAK